VIGISYLGGNIMIIVKCRECPKKMRNKSCKLIIKFNKNIIQVSKPEPIYEDSGSYRVLQGCDAYR
jgi:hypothetical protein